MRSSLVLRFTARPPALMAGSAEFFTTLVLIRSVYTVLVRSASYTPHRRRSSDRISHYGPARRIAATQQSNGKPESSGQAGRGEGRREALDQADVAFFMVVVARPSRQPIDFAIAVDHLRAVGLNRSRPVPKGIRPSTAHRPPAGCGLGACRFPNPVQSEATSPRRSAA